MKPAPVNAAALMVTADAPVDVRATDCAAAAVFTSTLPNTTVVALMLNVGTAAFICRAKASETLPAFAANPVGDYSGSAPSSRLVPTSSR